MADSVQTTGAATAQGKLRPVVFIFILGLIVVLMALVWQARQYARPKVAAQIEQNANTAARSLQSQVDSALESGVPFDQLVGVESVFKAELSNAKELAFVALLDGDGKTLNLIVRPDIPEQIAKDALASKPASLKEFELRTVVQPLTKVGSFVLEEPAPAALPAASGAASGVASAAASSAVKPASAVVAAASASTVTTASAAASAVASAASGVSVAEVAKPKPEVRQGKVVVGYPVNYIDQQMLSILIDLFFALVIALVLAGELLRAMWERSALKPLYSFERAWPHWVKDEKYAPGAWFEAARNNVIRWSRELSDRVRGIAVSTATAEIVQIRLAVFFVALSEELLRPFFTVFASEVTPIATGLSPTMLAGLPVAVFMFTLAVAQPLGPTIARRFNVQRAMLLACVVGALLLIGTAFTRNGLVLVMLRAGSGLVYGLMLILAQSVIVRITDSNTRARGLVEIPGAIVAAGIVGPAFGGVLAERAGYAFSFIACGMCFLVAAWLSIRLSPIPQDSNPAAVTAGWRGFIAVMKQARVAAVTWFAAVPARLAAAGLLVVVTPLYLMEIGEAATISGRVLLLYFLFFMITAPIVAKLSDQTMRRKPWIVAGCALSAVACLAMPVVQGVWGVAIACSLLGIAQALLSSPQLALVTEVFDHQQMGSSKEQAEQALAAFRLIERLGSILAPFVIAFAVAKFGLAGAMGVVGVVLAIGTFGAVIALWGYNETRKLQGAA